MTAILSDGLKVAAGDPRWEGSLPAGGEEVLEISFVLIGPPPQEVTVRAEGRSRGGGTFEKKITRKIGG